MKRLLKQCWKNIRGQDLIEYALLAGFVVVAAGVVVPGVALSISAIFSQVTTVITAPAPEGGSTP
jgi:pilus assembly protein Flp/PilA